MDTLLRQSTSNNSAFSLLESTHFSSRKVKASTENISKIKVITQQMKISHLHDFCGLVVVPSVYISINPLHIISKILSYTIFI